MEYLKKYWIFSMLAFIGLAFIEIELVFLLLSLIMIYQSIYYYLGAKAIYKTGVETTGVVLFYSRDEDGYKTPTVKYDANGKDIQKEPFYYASTDLSKFRSYKSHIDTTITIKYDPEKPENFVINSDKDFNWGTIVLFLFVGMIFLGLSIAGLLGYIHFDK